MQVIFTSSSTALLFFCCISRTVGLRCCSPALSYSCFHQFNNLTLTCKPSWSQAQTKIDYNLYYRCTIIARKSARCWRWYLNVLLPPIPVTSSQRGRYFYDKVGLFWPIFVGFPMGQRHIFIAEFRPFYYQFSHVCSVPDFQLFMRHPVIIHLWSCTEFSYWSKKKWRKLVFFIVTIATFPCFCRPCDSVRISGLRYYSPGGWRALVLVLFNLVVFARAIMSCFIFANLGTTEGPAS